MGNPVKTEWTIKNGQSRKNRVGNQEWTIQKKPSGQSRMDVTETLTPLGTCHRTKANNNIAKAR